MKCDSWASLLACTFASFCFGRKPKAKVATFLNNHFLIFQKEFKFGLGQIS
jgi:hypothetical protein